jgi:hypothetical protein
LTPNHDIDPYICAEFDMTFDKIVSRSNEIINIFNRIELLTAKLDDDKECIAKLNALARMTGYTIGEMIMQGNDARVMWEMFGKIVQDSLIIDALEWSE